MLDIKLIRENPERIKEAAKQKRFDCDIDRLIEVDTRRRKVQQELDALRTRSREGGQQLALYRNPKSDWYKRAVESGKTTEWGGLSGAPRSQTTFSCP